MKRVKSKLAIAVIAVTAIVLISAIGAYAYWSVSQLVAGNQLASGSMSIAVNDEGQQVVTPLIVSGLVPVSPPPAPVTAGNKKTYTIQSAAGNPPTDLVFSIPTVTGEGTLKDNVKVAFALTTSGTNGYWLEPNGAVAMTAGENTDNTYSNHAFVMSEYLLKSWADLPGYTDMAPGITSLRHVVVYYYLPLDCAGDCHDSSVTFDMSFELLQSH